MYATGQRNRLGNSNQAESQKGSNNAGGDNQTVYELAMQVLWTKINLNIEILMARNVPSYEIVYLKHMPTTYRILPRLIDFLISYVNNLEPIQVEKSMGF